MLRLVAPSSVVVVVETICGVSSVLLEEEAGRGFMTGLSMNFHHEEKLIFERASLPIFAPILLNHSHNFI